MNIHEIFKLDISLEHMSSIAAARGMWEMEDVKEMISKDGFCGGGSLYYNPNSTNESSDEGKRPISSGQKIVNYIFEQLDLLKIPDHLLHNIKSLVVKIGQKIFYWTRYLIQVLELDKRYAEKIFFTSYGQIDELRILQEFWLSDKTLPKMNRCNCFMGDQDSKYCVASLYGLEDFVKNNIYYMKNKICQYLAYKYQRENWTPYAVMATWVCFCSNRCKSPAVKEFRSFNKIADQLPANDMLMKCISKGNLFGAKYFWNKVEEEVKIDLASKAALESLQFKNRYIGHRETDNFETRLRTGRTYAKEMSVGLFWFFLHQMTEIQILNIPNYQWIEIFKLFFQIWPYQEMCEKLLHWFWDYKLINIEERNSNRDRKDWVKAYKVDLLNLIFNNLISKDKESCPDYFTMKNFYDKIFRNLIKKSSEEVKLHFVSSANYTILHDSYKIFDIKILSLIINDVDLKERRNEMFNIGNEYFKDLLLKRDYENMNKFIKNMKMSDEEIIPFKKNLNLLYKILISGDLASAEEHLNWLIDGDEERRGLKNELNAAEIHFFLVQNCKYDVANEFLLWRFDNEEERKKIKEPLKSEESLINKVFETWSGNVPYCRNKYAEKCSSLLNWYFESEKKIIAFKKIDLVMDRFLIQKYWDALCNDKNLKNFDAFLNFCSMTPEEIEGMKTNIASNINWWIDTYGLEKTKHFEMLQDVLKWIYGNNDDERKRVIRNYMISSRGSLLCIQIFKHYKDKSPAIVAAFFNTWIEPSCNLEVLKMHLDKCVADEEPYYLRGLIFEIKYYLEKREANTLIDE